MQRILSFTNLQLKALLDRCQLCQQFLIWWRAVPPLLMLLSLFLFCLSIGLLFKIWGNQGILATLSHLEQQITQQQQLNAQFGQRNEQLLVQVNALREGLDMVETRARYDLGMVKKDETFFFWLDPVPLTGVWPAVNITNQKKLNDNQ